MEIVDLRTEKFRSYRSEDDATSGDEMDNEGEDENNFDLIAEGEWIEIFWKRAKIYFPCKVISWTPLRATRRTLKSSSMRTPNPRRSSPFPGVPGEGEMKGSSTNRTRRQSSQTREQETSVATPQKLMGRLGMATRRGNNDEPVAPAKKPTNLEITAIDQPRSPRRRGHRVEKQQDTITPVKESKQTANSTASPIVEEAVFKPRKQLKRQGEKQTGSSSVAAVSSAAMKKSKLQVETQQLGAEAAKKMELMVPEPRVLRERKDKKNERQTARRTSTSGTSPPPANTSTTAPRTMLVATPIADVKSRNQKWIGNDQPQKVAVASPRQYHHHEKLRRGNDKPVNQPAGRSLNHSGLIDTEASEQDITTNVHDNSGGLLHKNEARHHSHHKSSSHGSNDGDDESSSALSVCYEEDDDDDDEGESLSNNNEGVPLYDEPEDDFDSSSSSSDSDEESDEDDADDENDSDNDHHVYHYDDDDDGSDDAVDNDEKRLFADQEEEGPKLTFEELWTLKLKRTQELCFR